MKKLILGVIGIGLVVLLSGCTALLGDKEYKSGVVDYRMVHNKKEGKDSIVVKHYDFNQTNSGDSYFTSGDYLDIRLSNIMYNRSFDPAWHQKNKNKLINNIGIFVTVKEINPISDLNDTIYPDKTLIYADNVYVKAKANQSFTPIFFSKYHGGDLQLEINVVEFDNKDRDSNRYLPLLENIVKLSQNAINNGVLGKVVSTTGKHYLGMEGLNKLGSSLLSSFSKNHDDLITSYKLNLIAPGTVTNRDLHKLPYLKEGDIVFVRLEEGDVNNKTSNWKNFKFNSKEKIIEDEYSNNKGTDNKGTERKFKDYYSYIVLTIIKRTLEN